MRSVGCLLFSTERTLVYSDSSSFIMSNATTPMFFFLRYDFPCESPSTSHITLPCAIRVVFNVTAS